MIRCSVGPYPGTLRYLLRRSRSSRKGSGFRIHRLPLFAGTTLGWREFAAREKTDLARTAGLLTWRRGYNTAENRWLQRFGVGPAGEPRQW